MGVTGDSELVEKRRCPSAVWEIVFSQRGDHNSISHSNCFSSAVTLTKPLPSIVGGDEGARPVFSLIEYGKTCLCGKRMLCDFQVYLIKGAILCLVLLGCLK